MALPPGFEVRLHFALQVPLASQESQCSPHPLAAVAYFCLFQVLCGLVLLNLVIGVILDNFESSLHDEELQVGVAAGQGSKASAETACDRIGTTLLAACRAGAVKQRVPTLLATHAPPANTQTHTPQVSGGSISHFAEAWADLDPGATNYIPVLKLSHLVASLPPPLGARGQAQLRAGVQAILVATDIPIRSGNKVRAWAAE
jgi:hypothetical protein